MSTLIRTQFRVVSALTIREIQSQQVSLVYGYGWVLFDALLSFAGLLIIKLAIRGFNTPGLPPITFLISGLVPWLMFHATYAAPDGVIKRNKRMLLLPMVTELDLILAASIRIFVTFSVLFVALATVAAFYEHTSFPRFPLGIFLLFVCMSLMGISFGIFLMILTRLYAPAAKFTSFFLRFAMIISGVIFQITAFPESIWPYLTWNPMLHIEELLRTYWFYNYHSPVGSPTFVVESLIAMTVLGLLLERYARRRLPPR